MASDRRKTQSKRKALISFRKHCDSKLFFELLHLFQFFAPFPNFFNSPELIIPSVSRFEIKCYLYKRTLEDASVMLMHAKQKENEVNPVTQVFYHPTQTDCIETQSNWKLMDLDEDFIKKLEDGERLILKGSEDEKIVLCTDDETYEVKEGEISNSLIVCPDLFYNSTIKAMSSCDRTLEEQKVCGIFNNYLELRLTFPRLNKLRSLMAPTAYQGPNEPEDANLGYYFSELLDNIQCSRSQLIAQLKELKAICIDDKWRILDLEYETRALSYLISLMEEQKWEEIHAEESKRILKSVLPDFIVSHILEFYATSLDNDPNLYVFKEDKVSQCFAEMLLRTAEGKFRYNEFIMAWEQCLPKGFKPDLKHLKGLALVEKEGLHQEVIHLFPEYNLPENISERFRLLFKRKEKWTLDEITPYIERLATKAMNVNTMLTRYARVSNLKGMRVFGARYAN